MSIRTALIVATVAAAGTVSSAQAQVTYYGATLTSAGEANPSTGTGWTVLTYDAAAHTLRVQATFSNLQGNTTASHIHGLTASPGVGNASVATQLPSFVGFPLGVSAGTYDQTFNLTLPTSWSAAFITANGGTTAGAEAQMVNGLNAGRMYLNIHSSYSPGGEIRGFPVQIPTPGAAAMLGLGGLVAARRRRA